MTADGGGVALVIEHDRGVAELARLYLARAGYDVHVETDPVRAVRAVRARRPDVVVVDLAAGRPELYPDVAAAAAGAAIVCVVPDGVAAPGGIAVTRPFSPRALVAAVGRALRGDETPVREGHAEMLRSGQVTLHFTERTVTSAGRPVALTSTEFDLLAYLMRHPERAHTRERLLAAVWGTVRGPGGARTVDVHIAQVRAKLGAASPIRTVRGVGYAVDA